MGESDNDDTKIRFSITLSTDQSHFLRRTCPSCGRDFKTEINQSDIASLIDPQIRRIGFDIGERAESMEESPESVLHCPYCEFQAEASKMLTQETIDYLHRHFTREYVLPMFDKAFAPLNNIGSRSGGFLSISLEYKRSLLPARPIHGPELPDMQIIHFLCCDKRAKVAENWTAVEFCTYCGTQITLM
jgi:hypothetical protein